MALHGCTKAQSSTRLPQYSHATAATSSLNGNLWSPVTTQLRSSAKQRSTYFVFNKATRMHLAGYLASSWGPISFFLLQT